MIPHSAPTTGEVEIEAAARVLRSGHLAQGQEVEAFEQAMAEATQRRYGVAVNSGTSALHLALAALDIQAGEHVAMPSYACAALATAVALQGATPALCDIGEDFNLDPDAVPPEAKAVIVAHLFGAPARLPSATGLVIEDIAQSLGGETGRTAPLAVASFYATKLITSAGEGGMVLTDDENLAEAVRDRREYDNREDFRTRYSYKMTDVQAAVGRVQLARLPGFIARRRAIAARYAQAFADLPLVLPSPEGHVFFRYVVRSERREALEAHLRACDIEAKRPVYRPAHQYAALGARAERFPVSERAHREGLSLPIFPAMEDCAVARVIECVRDFWHA